jgi:hypothetical protein
MISRWSSILELAARCERMPGNSSLNPVREALPTNRELFDASRLFLQNAGVSAFDMLLPIDFD